MATGIIQRRTQLRAAARWAATLLVPLLAGAGTLRAQSGPCAAGPAALARAVLTARAPTGLPEAQQRLFGGVVAQLRAGDTAGASSSLGALLKARPTLGRGAGLCALLHAAVRQGTLEGDPRLLSRMRALAATGQGGDRSEDTLRTSSQNYQQAVTTLAGIQKQMYDEAMKVLANLRS